MDIKKTTLYFLVSFLGVLLFNTWMRDYSPPTPKQQATAVHTSIDGKQVPSSYTPSVFTPEALGKTTTNKAPRVGHLLNVKTDVLDIEIDFNGGNIVSAKLLKYPISLEEKDTPVQILDKDVGNLYIAESGLTTGNNTSSSVQFTSKEKNFALKDGQTELVVPLTARTADGLLITKTYTFHRNDYAIRLNYEIKNQASKSWEGSLYTQLTRREPYEENSHFYLHSYNGAALSSPEIPYEKVTYDLLHKKNIDRTVKGGWLAMQQQYFLSAWIPGDRELNYRYYSHVMPYQDSQKDVYVIGLVTPQITVAPGNTVTTQATLYVGPEVSKDLKALAPGLERTIDYGWFWPISMLLFKLMSFVHNIVKNWGWSIIFTTILIKILFYSFSAKSFRSMARMREMQPRLQALKERYGEDRQALSQATMELYRKEKINPLGGCLPMLIQIPVFIALYYVIVESVELRQAPFIGWIHDLSAKDPYYILPILMGLSMLVQQWLSPSSPDPAQQKVMWILPIIFTVFFINFPSGLVLYWITNNLVQTLQQWYVNKTYESHKAKLKRPKSKTKKINSNSN